MFNTFFYHPLYNLLMWFVDALPNNDAGIAVVCLTLLVSVALLSISKKAIKTQLALKVIEPELLKIKNEITNKEEQARQTLAIYKKYKVNPFSMMALVIIQIPILLALFYAFRGLPAIDTEALYSFVKAPPAVNMMFFGVFDIGQRSIVMAVIAGVTQFIQAYIVTSYKQKPKVADDAKKTMQEQFAHSMQTQMKYVLPVVIGFISAGLPAALPLYWSVRNVFTSFQELAVRKKGVTLNKN